MHLFIGEIFMKTISKVLAILIAAVLLCPLGITASAESDNVITIELSSAQSGGVYTHSAIVEGEKAVEYDYTWHADPSCDHGEVKNSPAEYYTGTKPSGDEGVYIAHDIIYYPLLDEEKFKQVNYDGETEWVYMYEAEGFEDYIFSTLPNLKTGLPTYMMHSEEDAYGNAVLHITEPGTYELKGNWHGQIRVELEDSFDDESKKVTLILNGVDIECTVASGVVFSEVYECDNAWEDAEDYSHKVDTSEAGARVILADGTVNSVSGTNTFRILKTKYKDDDSTDAYPAQKKAYKLDGAFYSYQSMNIEGGEEGTGVLNITSQYEGLNSELHLTIKGGNINIYSQDDGINVNEDGVSVLTVADGNLHISAGLGSEGDGIDSNGFLVVSGGTVITTANPGADSGMDSDCGSFVLGGTVVALGATMDWAKADSSEPEQAVINMRFLSSQNSGEAIIITDENDKVVFAYDPDKDEVTGENKRTYSGAIISSAGLKIGGKYKIYVGGDLQGNEVSGVYDAATVTSFTGATRQCYSGSEIGGMGNMGGGFRPDGMGGNGGFDPENIPERPSGDTKWPEGDMQKPDGDMSTPPDFEGSKGDFTGIPQGDFSNFGQQGGIVATCQYEALFELDKAVNNFSGVTDYGHQLKQAENSEGYFCAGCGARFKDAEGTIQLETDNTILYIVISICTILVAAAAVTAIIVIKKNKVE